MTIGELETADYQMELLYGSSLVEQADALLEMIDQGESKELMVQLTEAYKSQNLDQLWAVFQEQITGYEYDAIVKVRNLNREKQMKEILPKQTTMFVVDAGHLPGEFGMINLLREAGYKVSSYLSMPSMSGMSLSFDLLANAQVGFKLYF